ncbi:hypothetical protein BD779DRAFT_1470269 [Infundibulicybe gibba]|nr:hypothetical protein BD779DRAFT_1470269 [Infundibulicybe gibba]
MAPKKKGKQQLTPGITGPQEPKVMRKVSRSMGNMDATASRHQPPAHTTSEAGNYDKTTNDSRRPLLFTQGTTQRLTILPLRTTRGRGGAVEQLKLVSKSIRPDLEQPKGRAPKENIPEGTPVNPMSPPKRYQRHQPKDPLILPRRQDTSLIGPAPTPTLRQATTSSGYGFSDHLDSGNTVDTRFSGMQYSTTSIDNSQIDPRLFDEKPATIYHNFQPSANSETSPEESSPNGAAETVLLVDHINEISSGEDERNALAVLRQDNYQGPEELGDNRSDSSKDEFDILDDYRRRNHSTQAPNPDHLNSHQHNHTLSSDAQETLADDLDDPPHQSKPQAPIRALRHSKKSYNEHIILPTQFNFYPSQWRDVLGLAKPKFRHYITTTDLFPKRQTNLQVATNFLMEAISDHERNGGLFEEGYLQTHRKNMTIVIFEDGSTFRGEMKTLAREIVKNRYDIPNPCSPDSMPQGQGEYLAMIDRCVSQLLDKGVYLHGAKDDSGHTSNFGHPALQELCIQFYYKNNTKAIGMQFSDFLEEVPREAIALAATCIHNCLDEWRGSKQTTIKFSGVAYRSVYGTMIKLMDKIQGNATHRQKFNESRRQWVQLGRMQLGEDQALNDHGLEVDLD